MQYKILLSVVLSVAAALPMRAQQQGPAPKAVAQAIACDTIKATKPVAKPGKQLASATGDAKGYRPVPLAGEKAYFGDKTEYVNNFVRKYLERNNENLGNVKSRSATPFSVIDNVLEKKSLPKELKYLAVIESALNHNAVSHAGAVGPWQLMESTARLMGLTVSRHKDERTDWYKSTNAATKYLEVLYSQLNDWLLVIAAYNSGPTPVQKAIERTGSHSFWDIKEYLPKETQGHVLAFIATASIFENLSKFINLGSVPVDFKFSKDKEDETAVPAAVSALATARDAAGKPAALASTPTAATPPATATLVRKPAYTEDEMKNMAVVRITEPVQIDVLSQEIGTDKKVLARWNYDIDQFAAKTYPTPFYSLRIPKDKVDAFLQKKDVITKKSKVAIAQIK
jgi:membrane-bound lytic murein transglycosylase D